jgi:hypothetical protein
LVAARVPNRRIEQEMGLEPGSLGSGGGRTSGVGGGQPSGAVASEPQPGAGQQPSGVGAVAPRPQPGAGGTNAAVITPDLQPEPPVLRSIAPGERKDRYEAYVKNENDAYKKRLEAYQNRVKLEQKEAEAFRTTRFSTRDRLSDMVKSIDVIDSGKHNLGPNFSLAGAGPLPGIQQMFGKQFGTDDSANTDKLLSMITKDGLQGIKDSMGPSISNFDVQAWLKANPISANSPPERIKQWLIKTHDTMLAEAESKKQVAVKHGMVESSFNLGKPLAGATTDTGTTSTGVKWKRAE